MPTLQEFDLHCRGSAQVVEEWQLPQSEARRLWRIDDLVAVVNDAISNTIALYDQYCQEGSLPGFDDASPGQSAISYFIKVAEKISATAHTVDEIASKCEQDGCLVHGLSVLRPGITRLERVLAAAQWKEIDLTAPNDDELARYAEEVRPPVDYYSE